MSGARNLVIDPAASNNWNDQQVSAETSVQNPVPQVTREYRSHIPARTVRQRHQGANELYRGSLDLSSIRTADEKTVHNIVEHGPPLRFTRREMAAGENLLAHMSDAISPHPPAASSRLASAQLQSSAAAALAAAAAHDAVVNARTTATAAVPESDSKHAAIAPHIAHSLAAPASAMVAGLAAAAATARHPSAVAAHPVLGPAHGLHPDHAAAVRPSTAGLAAAKAAGPRRHRTAMALAAADKPAAKLAAKPEKAGATGEAPSRRPVHFDFKGFGMSLAGKVTWQPGSAAWYAYQDELAESAGVRSAGAGASVASVVVALAAAAAAALLV